MLHPFAYPTVRHVRTHDPRPGKPYASYRRYKKALRLEFARRCVYCRRPDLETELALFHVDHYKPRDIAPELITVYSNLFYSCSSCNNSKDVYWDDPKRAGSHCIPNPCDHVMSDHLKYDGANLKSRGTNPGNAALRVLDLEDPALVAWRAGELRQIGRIRHEIATGRRQLKKIRTEMLRSNPPGRAAKLLAAKERVVHEIELAKSDLHRVYDLDE